MRDDDGRRRRKKLSSYLVCLTPKWSCKQLVLGREMLFALRRIAQIILSLSLSAWTSDLLTQYEYLWWNWKTHDERQRTRKPKNRNRNRRLLRATTTGTEDPQSRQCKGILPVYGNDAGLTMRAFARAVLASFIFNDKRRAFACLRLSLSEWVSCPRRLHSIKDSSGIGNWPLSSADIPPELHCRTLHPNKL